jgi:hypothetical protein
LPPGRKGFSSAAVSRIIADVTVKEGPIAR